MEKIIMQKTFNFGKIAYENPGHRLNAVTVNAELRRCGGEPTFIIDRTTGEHTSTGTTPNTSSFLSAVKSGTGFTLIFCVAVNV